VLVIVLVLVIDSLEVSKKHPSLPSFKFSHSDPLLTTQQRSKLDNEHDDEHDLGSEAMNDNCGLPLLQG